MGEGWIKWLLNEHQFLNVSNLVCVNFFSFQVVFNVEIVNVFLKFYLKKSPAGGSYLSYSDRTLPQAFSVPQSSLTVFTAVLDVSIQSLIPGGHLYVAGTP